MGARFVAPCNREQAARLAGYVDETLAALDCEMDVPVMVGPRHAVGGGSATTVAWADRRGVHIPVDVFDLPDGRLRLITVEETAHYWHIRAHPRAAASPLHDETFACWVTGHVTRIAWTPLHMPPNPDRYVLGRYAGAALAGSDEARDELKAAGAGSVLRMVGRLEKQLGDNPDPQMLATLLVAELGGR